MADEFSVEFDEDEVMAGLDFQDRMMKIHLKEFLEGLANKGVDILRGYAPDHDASDHFGYSSGYTNRHIDHSDVRWAAGGAGGGGSYEITLGVKAGTSYHPVYANSGTGIYSYTSDYIRSSRGRLMFFYASRIGHIISTYQVAGQRPQRFLYDTWRDLGIYAELRMAAGTWF